MDCLHDTGRWRTEGERSAVWVAGFRPKCRTRCAPAACGSGDVLVKKIAPGVHENHARLVPRKRLQKAFRVPRRVKAGFKGMSRHAAETLRKTRGVAILAPGADLGATDNGIPRRVAPFDRALVSHFISPPRQHTRDFRDELAFGGSSTRLYRRSEAGLRSRTQEANPEHCAQQ
jgi:hypothetical protein